MSGVRYDDAVNDALDRLDDLGFEWDEHDFVNHGPMGAEALALLGFPDQVAGWTDRYHRRPHHDPPAPHLPVDAGDEQSWRPALGAFDRVGDWEVLFARELAEEPWRDVLARWWPRLLPGLLAGLTHGVIRVAHAVRAISAVGEPSAQQRTELARGLAYWAARYHPLPGHPALRGTRSVAQAVAALPRPGGAGGPGARLARIGGLPGVHEAARTLAPDDAQRLISDMTVEFAGVYAVQAIAANPVPLVHAVTAPAAVRLVLPHLPTAVHEPSVAALWQVHTAMLVAFTDDAGGESDALTRAVETEQPGAGDLAARAAEHGDEHVIKFTEAVLREHALRPDPRFPAAALAAMERIPRAEDLARRLG